MLPFAPHHVGQVAAGTSNKPTATVTLYDTDCNKESCVAAIGTGPVDAAYKAIDELLGTQGTRLMEYSVARYDLSPGYLVVPVFCSFGW